MSPTYRVFATTLPALFALFAAPYSWCQSYTVDLEPATPGLQSTLSVPLGTSPIPVEVVMISPGPGFMASGFTSYGVATEFNDVAGILTLLPVAPGYPATFDPSGGGLSGAAPGLMDLGDPVTAVGSGSPLATLGFPPAATGTAGAFTSSDGGAGVFTAPAALFYGGPGGMPPGGTLITMHAVSFEASAVGSSDVAPIGLFPCASYPACAALAGPPAPPMAVSGPGTWPSVAELYDETTGTPIAATGIPPVFPGVITVTMPLPVELVAFEAVVDGSSAVLTWETASETDNLGFEIQHIEKEDGPLPFENWHKVGFVEGKGSASRGGTYRYEVVSLQVGRHLFRLKQVDLDGATDYSDMIEVEIALPVSYRLSSAYPNPFNPETTITLAVDRDQRVTIEVFDLAGRRVAVLLNEMVQANAERRVVFRADELTSGVYIYRATGQFFQASRTVAVVR